MNWKQFYISRFILSLKHPFTMMFIILAIIVALSLGALAQADNDPVLNIAIVHQDQGSSGQRLIDFVSNHSYLNVEITTQQQASILLNQDRLEAYFIIPQNYSEKMGRRDFSNSIIPVVAPSSRFTAAVSEPFITGTLMLYTEQLVFDRTRYFFSQNDIPYTQAIYNRQKQDAQAIWTEGSQIKVNQITLQAEENEQKQNNKANVFSQLSTGTTTALRWYAALSIFYIIGGSSWLLDIMRKNILLRIIQLDISLWKLILLSSLPPLSIATAGFLVTGFIGISFWGGSVMSVFLLLPVYIIYMAAISSIMILMSNMVSQPLTFLFAAPAITFIHAIWSGLIAPLPQWAKVLESISIILPGYWFGNIISKFETISTVDKTSLSVGFESAKNLSSSDVNNFLFILTGLLICNTFWFILGSGSYILRAKSNKGKAHEFNR